MLNPKLLAVYVGVLGTVTESAVMSDPTTAVYSLSAFAIGDWGTTTYQGSCCTRSGSFNNYDINAEQVVASLMNTVAGNTTNVLPRVVMGHGDSIYWNGIISEQERDSRFTTTFEEKFNGKNILTIPWVNVMGNHDYGGASYICNLGEKSVKCESKEALIQGIENKFKWQKEYVSHNDNRWILKDRFYIHRIENPVTGVSIDIFNIDTNDADIHGAAHICCQCYGYSDGNSAACRDVGLGHPFCCGGDTDMFNGCMDKFTEWGKNSRAQIAETVKQSNATWKIVNSHYSPYNHYAEKGMKVWFDTLEGLGLNVWINGHTHGEKHDFSPVKGIHFLENGAGGGIQKEPASGIPAYATSYVKNLWTYTPDGYGFMSLQASKDYLKLQYHTADNLWEFGSDFATTKVGGVRTDHCWLIPADRTEGRQC